MAFRVLSQISSIRQITTKNFRSLSADRSSLISLSNNNGIRVIQETPQQFQVFHHRSLSQPPILIRKHSSSQNEASEDERPSITTTKEQVEEDQDLGSDRDRLKQELVQAVLSQQEYTTKVADRIAVENDDIPRYVLSCTEEKFSPERLDFINQQKTISLMSYAKSNSSLQPSRMNNSSDVYKTELLKSMQQKAKRIIGENSSRDYSTLSIININQIVTDNFNFDINEETQRQIFLPSRDHIQNLLTNVTTSNLMHGTTYLNQCKPNNILNDMLLSNHEPQVKTSLNKNCEKNFLVSNILQNVQKRQISTFYNYEDPDCPRPKVHKYAPQPKTCVSKPMDKSPRKDCPPPPKPPTPPPVPLPRIPKRSVPQPPLVCPRVDVCPERADAHFKVKEKTLPCLDLGNCPCIDPEPLKEGSPFPRLTKRPITPPKVRCLPEDECPPRADECYKIKMKDLPCLVPGECDCIPHPLKEGPPLPRLKAKPVPDIPKLCLFEDPCPPRADAGLVVKPKKLRCLVPSTCPCIETPLRECNPLPRLKKKMVCEPLRLNCEDKYPCPERADSLCNYKISEKQLPTMILCQNHISTWEYNHATKRRFSSFAANNFLSRDNFIENDIKHMSQKYIKHLCNTHISDKHVKNKPCTEICPKLPTICPKLRRLVKRHPTVDPCKIEEKPDCFPLHCKRADLEADVKRKRLPCLKAKCKPPPCIPAPVSMKLVKLKKRFHYGDPKRPCPFLGCNKNLALADNLCGYEVRKKKLKPLLPCLPNNLHQNRHFHTTLIRDRKKKVKKNKKQKCKKPSKKAKSTCITFKVNCPPRARKSCKVGHKYKDCQKQNSPYKSFSECANHEIIETITECRKVNYLQPKNPILSPIVIQQPPPPKHANIDPKEEEMCVYKKLCMKNKGGTFDCDSFNKPTFPLRQMDFEDDERVPCPDPCEEDLKKSRKKKHCPAKEVEKCPEVSYKICEPDVCSKPKGAAAAEKGKKKKKGKEKGKAKGKDTCSKKPPKVNLKCGILPKEVCEEKKELRKQKECEKEEQRKQEKEKQKKEECEKQCAKEKERAQEKQCEKERQEKECEEKRKEKEKCREDAKDMCETRKKVSCEKIKTIHPSCAQRKPCDKITACDLLRPPPTPSKNKLKCVSKKAQSKTCKQQSKPTSFKERLLGFFKAKPNCPNPNDWKKKQLLQQAEKAAKAAGMTLCKPKSKATVKCKSFKAPTKCSIKSSTKCGSPEDVCKNVCENAFKKEKLDCRSKRHYSKHSRKGSGKKCKAPKPDCGKKGDGSKKAKKKAYKRESKPACGKEKPECGAKPDPCHTTPYDNCPKKVERSCRETFIQKDCCYVRAPYDCFSDMQKRFPRLPINECLEQESRIRQLRGNPIRPQEKKKKKSKTDKCRKHYSTYCPMRPFSTSIATQNFIDNLDKKFNELEIDYSLYKNILKDNLFDEFDDFSGLAEYDTLFYDYSK